VDGQLAQLVALAAHGSAWLAGRTGHDSPQLDGNSTFQYVRGVRFELAGKLLRSSTVSTDVADWLVGVRHRGITRLRLALLDGEALPDRGLIGFTGMWILVGASKDRSSEVWQASWTVGDSDAPDHRIWDVDYRGRRTSTVDLPRVNVAETMERLKAAVGQAETFAGHQGMDEWAAVFGAALLLGDAPDPVPPYHPDMFPPTAFGRPERRLLAMATRSFVFGGMGSWNDLGFPSADATARYEEVSAELHSAVMEAFVAAVDGSMER